ncbi:MAG: PCMD domain-containing protein [Bacteroidetes bacterium]|nr:PCMD domain-containing protein [Bacteroidota bacterium]
MMKIKAAVCFFLVMGTILLQGQTVIPNPGFENWTSFGNYSDPTGWDTPNEELMSIPFFGFTVVSKSTDHHGTGSFSAKLETKHLTIPPLDIPGFMTCGKLTIDIGTGSFVLSGGVPVVDIPTHLKGYYKYSPKGGDSCAIGILLTKTIAGIQDTIGFGSFSTKDTVADWTPFSAWIDYTSTTPPDTMNIIALSTAQEVMTIGTILYVDDLYLDYTVGTDKKDPSAGINVYNDRETKRLMVFLDFEDPETTTIKLINMTGQEVSALHPGVVKTDRQAIRYEQMPQGVYILEILHHNKVFSKKFFLNQ